jgi:hypothetical protein
LAKFLVPITYCGYNSPFDRLILEKIMFREELELLKSLQDKLAELRRYL